VVLVASTELEPESRRSPKLRPDHPATIDTCSLIQLRITNDDFKLIEHSLLGGTVEQCVALLTVPVSRTNRVLVRELVVPGDGDYVRRTASEAQLAPDFVAHVSRKARDHSMGIVFVHSHLGRRRPTFSATDDNGERHLSQFLQHRVPIGPHLAVVISQGGLGARLLGTNQPAEVVTVGPSLSFMSTQAPDGQTVISRFDRQMRAFGEVGQSTLRTLRVGIVGLGGTGCLVAEQLAHLGVAAFTLIDPDTVDSSNLNRLVNATESDVGARKVDVAARYIQSVAEAPVRCIGGDVTRARNALELRDADFIFICTDSHGSRAVVQQLSYQYLIPCIDMGVTIVVGKDRITHVSGRVQSLAPGLPCLICTHFLDTEQVRRDMMTTYERASDPYVRGNVREPAPAVISINATVASLAVTMFLGIALGVPSESRYLLYDALAPSLRSVRGTPDPNCFVCSANGALARGDTWTLAARQD
jgi:molybdopterin-synthase adenylyltransferase